VRVIISNLLITRVVMYVIKIRVDIIIELISRVDIWFLIMIMSKGVLIILLIIRYVMLLTGLAVSITIIIRWVDIDISFRFFHFDIL
jgi:hypothetical protein